ELSGFKKTVRQNVRVDVNETVRVDMKMEVGALQETLTVVGETPALQTDRADTGRIIPSVQLQEVPLGFNRNFQGMLLTVPGATRPFRPHSEFGNNEKTSAPGYFSHSNPPTKYLQSGFTLGGPIRRNRLFYFGDYQHTLDDAGRTQRATIPTAAFRNGDFSAAPTIIYNPFTGNADGTGRQPFPGNVI